MNIYIWRGLKNIGIIILKIALFIALSVSLVNTSLDCFANIVDDYSNYLYVRGFENYGKEVIAFQTRDKNDEDNVYTYIVDDVEYSYILDESSGASLDKTIKIYYDILEPNMAILHTELKDIDSFYADCFRDVANLYGLMLCNILGFSLLWFILDKIKYNKILWKQYV